LRRRTNLNASELAELIRVSPSTVTRIEKGQVCPRYDDMQEYIYRAGFKLACGICGELERLDHLRGYFSAAEIGEIVNKELKGGLDSEKLRVLLRVIPKLVYDWKDLPRAEMSKMMVPQPRVCQKEWQALLEGTVQFFAHSELLEDAPRWTYKTRLKRVFVPRAAVREISNKRFERLAKRAVPEFSNKNLLFSHDELQLI
jgi:transcriptional regulator with XRE-family HTH domain